MDCKMFWILVLSTMLLMETSHCDAPADYDIVLDTMNISDGEYLPTVDGMDEYPALDFGQITEPVIIETNLLKIKNKIFKAPFAINSIFKLENIKSSTCLFSLIENNITRLGICLTPASVDIIRVTLVSDSLPEKEVNFIVSGIIGKWTKLLLSIEEKRISISVNCTETEVVDFEEGHLWNVQISKETKMHLGNSPTGIWNLFKGVLQEIKIHPDHDKESVMKLICSEGPSLLDRIYEMEDTVNFNFDAPFFPTTNADTSPVPIEKGEKGDKGDSVIGPQGPQGPQGSPGDKGPPGPKGDDGKCECSYSMVTEIVRNMHDLRGKPGLEGKKGDSGKPGEPGSKGVPGSDGVPGSTGPPGPPGPPGPACKEKDSKTDAAVVKLKDVPEGPQGPPGPKGPQGVPGHKGDKGELGPKGDTGQNGDQGPIGPKGETGPPGNDSDIKLSTLLDSENSAYDEFFDKILNKYLKKNRNLLSNEITNEVQGPIGPPGPKGEKGDLGPIGKKGPKGVAGAKGAKGSKGEKGDQGATTAIDLSKLKGQKGEPGISSTSSPISGSPGPPGPPGPPGSPGPRGIPGVSIVGPKGEPGQVVNSDDLHSYKGNLVSDGDFYTAETVIVRSTTALFKRSSVTPLGTLAYVIMEKTLVIRIDGGWQHVMMGPIVKRSAEPEPNEVDKSRLKIQTPTEKKIQDKNRPKQYIRIAALNFPYRGSMYSIRRGRSKVKSDCHRQARRARIKGAFVPLLSVRGDDLSSLHLASDHSVSIANIRGEPLFDSWHAMFNDSEVSLSSPSPAIYSFDGRDVSIDPIWPQKAVWHGLRTSAAPREDCDGWSSPSPYRVGTASPLAYNKLLTPKTYACHSKLIVLCVEVPSSNISSKESNNTPF